MRNNSPARLTAKDSLELFVARVDDLSQTTLVKTHGLVNEWSLSFGVDRPNVFRTVQPNEDLLRSYLMDFRKFVSKSDPVFIGYIQGLCMKHLTSDELKGHIKACQEGWKRTMTTAGFKMEFFGKQITSEYIADLWINGHYFHDDPAKADELKRYVSPSIFMVRQEFLNFVFEATRVIGWTGHTAKVALRDGCLEF